MGEVGTWTLSVYRRHALFTRMTASRRPRTRSVAPRGPEIKYSLENEMGERERGRVISLRDYIELEILNHRKIYVRKKPMKERKDGRSYSGPEWYLQSILVFDSKEAPVLGRCNKGLPPVFSFFIVTIFVIDSAIAIMFHKLFVRLWRFLDTEKLYRVFFLTAILVFSQIKWRRRNTQWSFCI